MVVILPMPFLKCKGDPKSNAQFTLNGFDIYFICLTVEAFKLDDEIDSSRMLD